MSKRDNYVNLMGKCTSYHVFTQHTYFQALNMHDKHTPAHIIETAWVHVYTWKKGIYQISLRPGYTFPKA